MTNECGMDRVDPAAQDARWAAWVAARHGEPPGPFETDWRFYRECFRDRPVEAGPPRAWMPDDRVRAASNLGRLLQRLSLDRYEDLHAWSVRERAAFWKQALDELGIRFRTPPSRILDDSGGPEHPVWLPGASLNVVDSCFGADPSAVALRLGREGTSAIEEMSFAELEALVDRCARGLRALGIEPGDGVALYLPMNRECVAVYLAVVRAGAYVVSIPDSFSPAEVAKRLALGRAKLLVTAASFTRGGKTIPLYAKAVEADAPRCVVVPDAAAGGAAPTALPDLREGDLHWDGLLGEPGPFESIAGAPSTLTNVLFSSGTTGTPKAIPWSHLTPLKCAVDGRFHQDVRAGDTVAWPTNIGWMMGPWLIYAALVNRASIALYEGLPTGEGFARFVQDAGVTMLGTVPSLVRAWRGIDFGALDWSGIRTFSSTGEPSNAPDYLWLMSRARYAAPVIEYCGGTEIGGGYVTGTVVQPASPATFTTPALGLDLVLLDEEGRPAGDGETGDVYLVPPSIGLSQELLNRDHHAAYFADCPVGPRGETLRRHGDQMIRLPGGFYKAQGRSDDTMNLGGIKVGSLELERVLNTHEAVVECAAVGVQVGGEGAERLVVWVVPACGAGEGAPALDLAQLRDDLNRRLAAELNPLFRIHEVHTIDALPRTASNKLMRRELR